jgi:hypothetical protein
MRPSVVERCNLDVLDITPSVGPLVFKAQIRKVDVAVEERQIVFVRPVLDLSRVAVRTSIGVRPVSVAFVEKLLIFAFELVIQHNAVNPNVVFLKPFRSSHVRRMKLRVVRQFTGARIS